MILMSCSGHKIEFLQLDERVLGKSFTFPNKMIYENVTGDFDYDKVQRKYGRIIYSAHSLQYVIDYKDISKIEAIAIDMHFEILRGYRATVTGYKSAFVDDSTHFVIKDENNIVSVISKGGLRETNLGKIVYSLYPTHP